MEWKECAESFGFGLGSRVLRAGSRELGVEASTQSSNRFYQSTFSGGDIGTGQASYEAAEKQEYHFSRSMLQAIPKPAIYAKHTNHKVQ